MDTSEALKIVNKFVSESYKDFGGEKIFSGKSKKNQLLEEIGKNCVQFSQSNQELEDKLKELKLFLDEIEEVIKHGISKDGKKEFNFSNKSSEYIFEERCQEIESFFMEQKKPRRIFLRGI